MDNNAVIIADLKGVIRAWSDGAQSAFGHASTQAIGQTLDLIVPAEHREAHWRGFHRALSSGAAAVEGVVTPFPALTATGVIAVTPGRLTLLRRADGQVIGAMVVFG